MVRIGRIIIVLCVAVVRTGMAVVPDLTAGGVPDEDPAITINLGPTGARGWIYHVKTDTSESRQILISAVDAGSPADGVLAVGDVILGVDGTGITPVVFTSDARKSLALAIGAAEACSPATLKLLRWRNGTNTTEMLTLQTMGAYSSTAPYNCPKSAKILEEGLQYVFDNESAGRYSFGAMTLLATNDPAFHAKAQIEARALIPSQATMDQMMSDERDASSMITWQRGHTLIFLTEYYLVTGDAEILPAIEAYAVNIAKNTSLFGTVGHIFAGKNDDGSPNGPMGGVYGPVNTPGLFCFLGVLLAKECGLTNSELDPAINRASRFFAYYAGKGAIPYGEHNPFSQQHENNGKCGLSALAFMLQDNRVEESKFFVKMSTASATERELGHTGSYFNYLWAPLGAAVGGPEAAAAHFSRISWMLDLNRCWDGRFQYDCLNGEGHNSGSTWYDFRMSTVALLTYALPLRQLYITGKGHDSGNWLNSADVIEAIVADDYDADSRNDSELIADLGNWSPKVRKEAGDKLGTRSIDTSELSQITALANDTGGSSRAGACYALGQIGNSDSAATLATLLTDPDNYVRYMAAEAMRYLPTDDKRAQTDTILAAAASTAAPLYPMEEEDPLHFAHGRLAMLLFYSWTSFGPRGVIYDSLVGVDRNLLYPAIRAVAETPVGICRSTLEKTYDNLTYDDVLELSGTILDSIAHRSPSDKMFSEGVRRGGVVTLHKHGIAEGVPACMIYADDEVGGRRNTPLGLLGTFGGGVHTVEPDPGVVPFLESYLSDSETAATAQASLDAIAADTTTAPLTPLKSIQSVTADASTVHLPADSTILRVSAIDYTNGDSIYTWRKLSGPGSVSFTLNGTAAAATTTVQFDGTPGVYLFEVTMSDSSGLTEVTETIAVTATTGTEPPTVSFALASGSGPESATSRSATVVLSHTYAGTVTVEHSLATSSGSAALGQDFTYTSETLTFNEGETSKSFTFAVINDNEGEDDETINFKLGTISNGVAGVADSFVYTILSDAVDWGSIPFEETFEDLILGDLSGQRGWVSEGGVVQTNTSFGGSLKAGAITTPLGSIQHSFNGAKERVWTDMHLQVVQMNAKPRPDEDSTVAFYVATNSQVMVFDGTNAVSSSLTAAADTWVRFTTFSDYAAKTWLLYVNGIQAGPFGFFDPTVAGFRSLAVTGEGSFVDDLLVTESELFTLYASGGIITPLAWVLSYGGDPTLSNQDEDSLTLDQEYLIETDPTVSNAFKIITLGFTPTNTPYLHYNANGLPHGRLTVSNSTDLATGSWEPLAGSLSIFSNNVVEWTGSDPAGTNGIMRIHVTK